MWVLLLLLSIPTAKFGLDLMMEDEAWIGLCVVGIFGAVGVVAIWGLYDAAIGQLKIDDEGVRVSGLGFIRWDDIESIHVVAANGSSALSLTIADRRYRQFPAPMVFLRRCGGLSDNDVRIPLSAIFDRYRTEYAGYLELIGRHKRISGDTDVNAIPGRW